MGSERDADRAGQDDDQRADGGQDRPADEDVGEHGLAVLSLPAGTGGRRAARAPRPAPGAPSPIFWTPETISFSPGLQARLHDVVVADDGPRLHRPLARHGRAALARLGDEREELAVDAVERRRAAPSAPAPRSQTICARTNCSVRKPPACVERRLGQHGLRGRVHRRRDESEALRREALAGVVEHVHGQADLEAARLLDRHVDVDLQARVLVDASSARWSGSRCRRRAPGCRRRPPPSAP